MIFISCKCYNKYLIFLWNNDKYYFHLNKKRVIQIIKKQFVTLIGGWLYFAFYSVVNVQCKTSLLWWWQSVTQKRKRERKYEKNYGLKKWKIKKSFILTTTNVARIQKQLKGRETHTPQHKTLRCHAYSITPLHWNPKFFIVKPRTVIANSLGFPDGVFILAYKRLIK